MSQSVVMNPQGVDAHVLDTSVPMHDAGCFNNFHEHDVHFTLTSLGELDRLKSGSLGRDERKGYLAREALKALVPFERGDLFNAGAPLPGGGRLFFDAGSTCKKLSRSDRKKFPLSEDSADNRIIQAAWCLDQSKAGRYRRVRFVSKDLGQRMKARACGLETEDYLYDRTGSIDELHKRFTCLNEDDDMYDVLCSELVSAEKAGITVERARKLGARIQSDQNLHHNKCFLLQGTGNRKKMTVVLRKSPLGEQDRLFCLEEIHANPKLNRYIVPRNPEQNAVYSFLIDPAIDLVAILGDQGTGKTLLAIQAGWEQISHGFNEIMVFRPNIELGEKMGYLPGDLHEKFAPWMMPIFDQTEIISGSRDRRDARGRSDQSGDEAKDRMQNRNLGATLMDEGMLSIQPIAYIRGRSFHKKFIIVDEAQNLTPQEIKIMTGRAGEGTKVVLVGSALQVDHKYLDPFSNGLTYVAERFQGQRNFAYVTLQDAIRSKLAQQSNDLL